MVDQTKAHSEFAQIKKTELILEQRWGDGTLKETETIVALADGTELERIIEKYDEKGRRTLRDVMRRSPRPQ